MGVSNRTGTPWRGSHDIWILNEIAHLYDLLESGDGGIFKTARSSTLTWINGNGYIRSKETFGILPFQDTTRAALGFSAFNPSLANSIPIRHAYLASQQDVLYAVLPIHTNEEHALFKLLAALPGGLFAGVGEPDWQKVAVTWAEHCDGKIYRIS